VLEYRVAALEPNVVKRELLGGADYRLLLGGVDVLKPLVVYGEYPRAVKPGGD